MLCTPAAEGAQRGRAGLCSTGDPLVWCLLNQTGGAGGGFASDPGTGSECHHSGEGKEAQARRTSGREQSAALGALSGTNSCAVFHGVMQLLCSQII